ncbi:hypothetical protein, partial [Aeromonas cavernicola]|uniref:hypothetical protein n=1 Tax=Aeromonas cavernicola TaxID=1006623 RepID=UPI001F479843
SSSAWRLGAVLVGAHYREARQDDKGKIQNNAVYNPERPQSNQHGQYADKISLQPILQQQNHADFHK